MSDAFNEDDWLLEINKSPVEAAFLDSDFPKEIEVELLLGDEPSDMDGDYYDIVWTACHPEHPEDRMEPGLFIAFMAKAPYEAAFGGIGEPPDIDASVRAKLTVEKRDAPGDRKSHPKWQCWLEVMEATFLGWELDDDEDNDYDDEDEEDDEDRRKPVRISSEVGDPSEPIARKLDNLLAAFEAKEAVDIRGSLLPGLDQDEIAQQSSWFPGSLPDPVLELYEWANGQARDPWEEPSPFVFRDMGFLSLARAEVEYESMMSSYGVDNTLEDDGVVLATSFPIAAFNGGWYVVPTGKHELATDDPHPVVCVLEGIDMHFHSVPKMLDTCIEWVRSGSYTYEDAELDEREETAIWVKHNPGVFDD